MSHSIRSGYESSPTYPSRFLQIGMAAAAAVCVAFAPGAGAVDISATFNLSGVAFANCGTPGAASAQGSFSVDETTNTLTAYSLTLTDCALYAGDNPESFTPTTSVARIVTPPTAGSAEELLFTANSNISGDPTTDSFEIGFANTFAAGLGAVTFDVFNYWGPGCLPTGYLHIQCFATGQLGTDMGSAAIVLPTTTVPEPATLTLLGLGLAVVGFMRQRKAK